jgi:hypothetical protein
MSSGFENTKYKKNYTPSLSGSKGGYAKCHPPIQDLAQIYITGINSRTSDIISHNIIKISIENWGIKI